MNLRMHVYYTQIQVSILAHCQRVFIVALSYPSVYTR